MPLLSLSSFVLAASLSIITYLSFLHRCLKNRINHEKHHGALPGPDSTTIATIPSDVYSSKYYVLHDRASQRVPRQLLPPHHKDRDMLTLLLRRNMAAFAHFPQAYMLWATTPAVTRETFQASHIRSLDYNKGDLVCGIYRVLERSASKVEFGIAHKGIEGRMSIGFWDEDKDVVFASETAMWTKTMNEDAEEQRSTLPLENPVRCFFHELAAWWLLDSGVKYLVDLEGELDDD
ncbi:hypothetical protein BO70DRAFT_380461 [Aspergillus heteromorphus CBS 117.55]|uniref:Uncharacterized protein n=1 Tax=Aspergillus heteromorphus CBS 117.55 TaxID=1448321 RepID=A0A317VY65_9EURO|nr:uncharacterized protein BO70DRAFT_380461 [Aspergillus heteromorphus CBS 117.55]PWY79316.1 hypothetical protein BO70DRAFT_380461 [Aspergillus heteromorphus CBS 117.55]